MFHRLDAAGGGHQPQRVRAVERDVAVLLFALQQVQQLIARVQVHRGGHVAARRVDDHHAIAEVRVCGGEVHREQCLC
ncbi:MAG: hypothetical protein EBY24_23355 [Betaproteobacteria bacterium]|nr:hypothetical protein [Betaproteobacteria bacterium]